MRLRPDCSQQDVADWVTFATAYIQAAAHGEAEPSTLAEDAAEVADTLVDRKNAAFLEKI